MAVALYEQLFRDETKFSQTKSVADAVNLFHGLHSGLADRNSGMNNADLVRSRRYSF